MEDPKYQFLNHTFDANPMQSPILYRKHQNNYVGKVNCNGMDTNIFYHMQIQHDLARSSKGRIYIGK